MNAGSFDRKLDTKKRDIFENFKVYNLEKPELIRMDNHMFDRHIKLKPVEAISVGIKNSDLKRAVDYGEDSDGGLYDVVVTDPPYGIRAGAKKSGAT
jgi:23S rRNA G2445 N2-methylase RlmL